MRSTLLSLIVILMLFLAGVAQAQNVEYVSCYPDSISRVFVSGDYAYVTDDSILQIIDISNPASPVPTGNYTDTTSGVIIDDIFVRGDYAYVLYTHPQGPFWTFCFLDIIDISNPSNPTLMGSFGRTMYYSGDNVFVSEDCAYISRTRPEFMNPTYLDIFDVSDPDSACVVGTCNIPSFSTGLFVSGGYLYEAWVFNGPTSGLCIVSVADPTYPSVMATYDSLNCAQGAYISGSYAYIADWSSGLRILNVIDPYSPILTASYNTSGLAQGVFVSGSNAYAAEADSGVQVINIADPTNPVFAGGYDTQGLASDIYVSDGYIYVADITSLMILRFTPTGIEENDNLPNEFSLSHNYPNPFNPSTTIQYSLPEQSLVTIDIFDILGRRVETLAEGIKPAGNHQAVWDASNKSSGIYFYRIKAGDKAETKKMMLIK